MIKTTFYVTYACKMHYETEMRIAPRPTPIFSCLDANEAKLHFHKTFKSCFGDDMIYTILGISTNNHLVYDM